MRTHGLEQSIHIFYTFVHLKVHQCLPIFVELQQWCDLGLEVVQSVLNDLVRIVISRDEQLHAFFRRKTIGTGLLSWQDGRHVKGITYNVGYIKVVFAATAHSPSQQLLHSHLLIQRDVHCH